MKKSAVYVLIVLLMASTLPLNASADASQDIPSNAVATGVHDSLVAALTHADLVTTLQGAGPFTVFAPTDDALTNFAAENGFADVQEFLTSQYIEDFVERHIAIGYMQSTDLNNGETLSALNGDEIAITAWVKLEKFTSLAPSCLKLFVSYVCFSSFVHLVSEVKSSESGSGEEFSRRI